MAWVSPVSLVICVDYLNKVSKEKISVNLEREEGKRNSNPNFKLSVSSILSTSVEKVKLNLFVSIQKRRKTKANFTDNTYNN